ncbi:hydantoin utilization protein B [Streptosporangium violaceochromogenes]|nr:hydantoin utilization protein B [Streptosporangium violaceochromogenes]
MSGKALRSDPVALEILRNRFQAVVEEMAENITRTSFSVFVKQTADFGTCLVTPEGEVFAAPTEISGNLMIGIPAAPAIAALSPYRPGDVGVSNDPDGTRGLVTHLPDIWMWRPLYVGGELVAFAFGFVHSSDVGGSVPGSISWTNTDVYAEGLRVPPAKLYDAGVLNQPLLDTIMANCRIPEQNWGDMKALLAAFHTAQRRLDEIAERYGLPAVHAATADLLDQAERRAGDIVEGLPDGEYRFVDYVEGTADDAPPTRISCTMRIDGRRVALDFAGTGPRTDEAINLPTWGQAGHYMVVLALVNYFCTIDRGIPYNSGLVRPIGLELPEGSVVNPGPAAACGVRAAVFFRIMDCVLGCLAQALPGRIPAASSGAVAIVLVSSVEASTGRTRVSVAQPLTGGSGGRPALDGIDGTSYTGGWLRNVPNEVLEHEAPLLVEQYRYRPDSGGAGRWRGGAGIRLTLRALADSTVFAVRGMERMRFQPWGLDGGRAGAPARAVRNPGTATEQDLGRINVLRLDAGEVLDVETAGGGGLGDPYTRPPADVLADIVAGLLSPAAAERDYGVVLRDGAVDEQATAARRADAGSAGIDLGAARLRYERRWPQPVQDRLVEAVAPVRALNRGRAYRAVAAAAEAACTGIEVTVADVEAAAAAHLVRPAGPGRPAVRTTAAPGTGR